MSTLLARFAEHSLWLARYVERAENLARILDVNLVFARDSRGARDWLPIIRLHSDEERFFDLYDRADANNVVQFYITDRRNPNSIVQSIDAARENARSLRHLISLEIWSQLNVFCNWTSSLRTRHLALTGLSRLCGELKQGCDLHAGLVERAMYRDQVWLFHELGQYLERCDQTTRLVDIKYHTLVTPAEVGSELDVSQWSALLRSAAAYQPYLRAHPHELTPATVAGFILLDPLYPRSITRSVSRIKLVLGELLRQPELAAVDFPRATLQRLEALAAWSADQIIASGMHEYLDQVQLELLALGKQISATFFAGAVPA